MLDGVQTVKFDLRVAVEQRPGTCANLHSRSKASWLDDADLWAHRSGKLLCPISCVAIYNDAFIKSGPSSFAAREHEVVSVCSWMCCFHGGVTGLSHLAVCHAPIRGDSSGLAGFVLFLLLTPLISSVEARAHIDPRWSPFGLWLDECPFFFFARLVFLFFFSFWFYILVFKIWPMASIKSVMQFCKTALPLSLSVTARKSSALRSSLTRHHLWQPGNVFAPKRHQFFSPLWN